MVQPLESPRPAPQRRAPASAAASACCAAPSRSADPRSAWRSPGAAPSILRATASSPPPRDDHALATHLGQDELPHQGGLARQRRGIRWRHWRRRALPPAAPRSPRRSPGRFVLAVGFQDLDAQRAWRSAGTAPGRPGAARILSRAAMSSAAAVVDRRDGRFTPDRPYLVAAARAEHGAGEAQLLDHLACPRHDHTARIRRAGAADDGCLLRPATEDGESPASTARRRATRTPSVIVAAPGPPRSLSPCAPGRDGHKGDPMKTCPGTRRRSILRATLLPAAPRPARRARARPPNPM